MERKKNIGFFSYGPPIQISEYAHFLQGNLKWKLEEYLIVGQRAGYHCGSGVMAWQGLGAVTSISPFIVIIFLYMLTILP